MSVNLPHGLVGGAYLIRSELLALHEADKGRPQYFLGCAQIWLKSDGQLVPASTVSIPGNVRIKDASNNFNLYRRPLRLPYINPGPKLANLTRTGRIERTVQKEGLKQWRCICESGSNFCGVDVPDYHNEQGCWRVSIYFRCLEIYAKITSLASSVGINLTSVIHFHCRLEMRHVKHLKPNAKPFKRLATRVGEDRRIRESILLR